jgi:hypothetical protein
MGMGRLVLWKAKSAWPLKRGLTNRFKDEYSRVMKKEKKLILDHLAVIGMGRCAAHACSGSSGLDGRGSTGMPAQAVGGIKVSIRRETGRLLGRL